MTAYNKNLGTFELVGLPPAPRGVPQIEVTFDIDANGIVHVAAKDLGTGKEQSITISGGSGLSKEEIDRMMRDAEAHAAEDHKRREEVEARNNAEALVYQTEKFLKDNEDKIAETRGETDAALAETKSALEGTDMEAIKSAAEKLAAASQAMGAAMYQAEAAAGAEAGAGASGNPDDDIVEGEVVDEDKQP
ncbi:MAG: Hsp70 family protein, partial [Candidatus Nanopelagicales bacterium]